VVNAGSIITEEDGEEGINGAAVAAYRASIDTGEPSPERKLAAMFVKTSLGDLGLVTAGLDEMV